MRKQSTHYMRIDENTGIQTRGHADTHTNRHTLINGQFHANPFPTKMSSRLLTRPPSTAKRSVYEAQAQVLRQFIPNATIADTAPIAPQAAAASQPHLRQMYSSSPHKPVHLQQQIVPQPAKPVASAPSSSPLEQSTYTSLPAAPKGPPQGGWADPTAENFPGTGIVLAADSQGVLTVAGLVKVRD